jgi:hypothetical protein
MQTITIRKQFALACVIAALVFIGTPAAQTTINRFAQIILTGTGADSLKTAGGITAGGSVGIIGTDGRVPALSSTYFASLAASNLTGALPAISGANLTSLTAPNLTGLVPVASMGSGTPDGTKFLRDDRTWVTPTTGQTFYTGELKLFPSGTTCPSGWTRDTSSDNAFFRGASTGGLTGGADTHDHNASGTTSQVSVTHTHGFSGSGTTGTESASLAINQGDGASATLAEQQHTHPFSFSGTTGNDNNTLHDHTWGATTSASSNVPAYKTVVVCKKD